MPNSLTLSLGVIVLVRQIVSSTKGDPGDLAFGEIRGTGETGKRYAVRGFHEAIDRLTDADRTTVKALLDSFILDNRFQQIASTHTEQTS